MLESIQGAVVFLGCSILLSAGLLIIVSAIVAVNNIISKYWKNLNWFPMNSSPYIMLDEDRKNS